MSAYLAISSCEGHPRRRRPERYYKRDQAAVLRSSGLSGPDVNGTTERKRGADLSQDGGSNPHKDHGDNVRRPEGRVNSDDAKEIQRHPGHSTISLQVHLRGFLERRRIYRTEDLYKQRSQAQSLGPRNGPHASDEV